MSDAGFVRVPEGWFEMGHARGRPDERPPHRVWVDGFDMAVYPVTRVEYAAFLDATGHEAPREWETTVFDRPDLPVVGVSWHDAVDYCAWRSTDGAPLRLPTEAEWERAARGTRDRAHYPWGDEIPAWIPGGGRGPLDGPWPVTLGDPTDFGLYGITANVHEWCADWYAPDYYARSAARNPTGPDAGTRRASRGGSWRHAITLSRSTARSAIDPSFRYTDYGFRVVRGEPRTAG